MLSRLFHRLDEAHTHTQTARYTLLSALVKCPPPCLRLRFFHQKRKWKTRSCMGEGGGWLLVKVGEKRVWEREREGGCSHLELLHGTFTGGSAPHTAPFGFIGRGRWQLAGRVRGRAVEMLTVSYGTCTLPTGSTSTAISSTSERVNVCLLVWKAASCLRACLIFRSSLTRFRLEFVPCLCYHHGKYGLWFGVECANSCIAGFSHSYSSHKRYSAHNFAARPNVSLKRWPSMQKQTVWLVFRLWTWQD